MSFIAVLLALILEQVRPLAQVNAVHSANRGWVHWIVLHLDAGKVHHGRLVWSIAVLAPASLAFLVHWALTTSLGWLAAMVWNVAVLYVTLGFRQFSHHFTHIRDALYAGDEDAARGHLTQWMRNGANEPVRAQIVRQLIEYSIVSAHRHVFGVLAWYTVFTVLGLGPAGAVLYRTAEYLFRWTQRSLDPDSVPISDSLKRLSTHAWFLLDWVPVRITALAFAFVGSFEDAIESWRRHDARAPHDNDGVLLAAAAGAMNLQLGLGIDHTNGESPQVSHLRLVVGLVWRTVVMWMVALLLFTLARFIG